MKAILEKIQFNNPTDIDVARLQKIIDENDLTPADIKYRFSKLYNWQIKIVDGKLVFAYTVRYKRPKIEAAFAYNHMIVFESADRFILKDKNGVIHGCGITETDVTDVEYRKWTIAKKIGDFMGLTYLGDGVFEKIKIPM